MTDAALFDWDGTLSDSRAALLGAWHAATDEVLGRTWPHDAEGERLVFTLPGKQLFPRVAGDEDLGARLGAAFHPHYERTSAGVTAYPGIAGVLADLRRAGVRIAVVTSKARKRLHIDADRIGLAGAYDVAICVEDVETPKPDPAPVLLALERLGVEPGRAVMVGDTSVDVEAARAAGVAAIGVGWGPLGSAGLREAGASAIADSAEDLARIVMHDQERIAL